MTLVVVCTGCLKSLKAPPQLAGRKAPCPHCKTPVAIPALKTVPEEMMFRVAPETPPTDSSVSASRAATPALSAKSAASTATATSTPRKNTVGAATHPALATSSAAMPVPDMDLSMTVPWQIWLLLLAFIPLFLHVFRDESEVIIGRIRQTVTENPSLAEEYADATEEELIENIEEILEKAPGNQLAGTHLPTDTWMHWVYALISAVVYLGLVFLIFEVGKTQPHHLLISALATATVGILLLLTFQFLASSTDGFMFRGRNIVLLILFYVVKLIGLSYQIADDPSYGFWASFAGFTFGVGLCEEFVKALPVIFRIQSNESDGWRTACAWGFASGVGFGTAEGIMYSSDYYNGMADGSIYVVRFVSCVALHAIWSASVGVTVWRNREKFHSEQDWADWLLLVLTITGVPMVLHGLYDTLLKRDYDGWAALTAVVSIAWLFGSISWALRGEAGRRAAFHRRMVEKASATVRFH